MSNLISKFFDKHNNNGEFVHVNSLYKVFKKLDTTISKDDTVKHSLSSDNSTRSESAKTADNLSHKLTIKQDGKDDIIFDGSTDITINLTTTE